MFSTLIQGGWLVNEKYILGAGKVKEKWVDTWYLWLKFEETDWMLSQSESDSLYHQKSLEL